MKTDRLIAAIDNAFSFTCHNLHHGGLDLRCKWDFHPVTGQEDHLIRFNTTLANRDIPADRPLTAADLAERMRVEVFSDPENMTKVMGWLERYIQ